MPTYNVNKYSSLSFKSMTHLTREVAHYILLKLKVISILEFANL